MSSSRRKVLQQPRCMACSHVWPVLYQPHRSRMLSCPQTRLTPAADHLGAGPASRRCSAGLLPGLSD